ncbi:MAG: hypothetical protein ENTB_04218 [Enterocloster aldenensis]
MKVCLYIRLSSADKDLRFKAESESIANQRALLHQYLRDHREFFPYEIIEFVDDGFSGTNGNRPGFERMIEFLKDGGAKLVLCKDLSRFFRDYVEIGDYLERIFPFLGVRLIAINDGYDSDDYKGTTAGMDVVMKCIVYGFYSRDLSVKIKTVLTAKAKKGQYIGSYAPYGYLKDPQKKNHLIPDPVAALVVKRIFSLALTGMTTGEIAKTLNAEHYETPSQHFHRLYPDCKKFSNTSSESCWSSNNIREILMRKEYTGAVVSKRRKWKGIDSPQTLLQSESEWIIVPDCHEALITNEEYENAQNAILSGKSMENRRNHDYPLRSLVRCGVCGRVMQRCRGKNKTVFYKCDKSRYLEETACPIGERFSESDLEKIVISSLSQLLQTVVDEDKRIQEAAARTHGSAENMRRSILRIEQTVKQNQTAKMAAYERYSEGNITRDEFIRQKDRLAADTDRLTAEKAVLEKQLAVLEQAQASELHETAGTAAQFLKASDVTNEMLLNFIDRVLVFTGGRVEIVYRFSNPFLESLKALHEESEKNTQ